MDDYKEVTRAAFDDVARDYVQRDQAVVPETAEVRAALDEFSSSLHPGAVILDIGSGGGRDSRYFFEKGFKVIGVDFSEKMISEAKKIEARVDYRIMNFEQLDFPKENFDGIWANASLHHIPKENIQKVLRDILDLLKSGGIFFIKIKQGDSDGFRENEKFGKKITRYFAYYQPEEIEALVRSAGFSIMKIQKTIQDEWIDVFARK
jgi:SAM-dependent methyltransferase